MQAVKEQWCSMKFIAEHISSRHRIATSGQGCQQVLYVWHCMYTCITSITLLECNYISVITGVDTGGALNAQAPPLSAKTTYRTLGWTASFSTPPPARKPCIWLQNLAKNLFVEWRSRVPLTSLANCLVCGNYVGVVSLKWAWPKILCTLRARLFTLAPSLLEVLGPPLNHIAFHGNRAYFPQQPAARQHRDSEAEQSEAVQS